MPEILVVIAVFVVAAGAWVGAWMHARNPANQNASEEAARLRQHAAWLQHRIAVAEREKWDGGMVANLAEELAATARQLEQVPAGKTMQAGRTF